MVRHRAILVRSLASTSRSSSVFVGLYRGVLIRFVFLRPFNDSYWDIWTILQVAIVFFLYSWLSSCLFISDFLLFKFDKTLKSGGTQAVKRQWTIWLPFISCISTWHCCSSTRTLRMMPSSSLILPLNLSSLFLYLLSWWTNNYLWNFNLLIFSCHGFSRDCWLLSVA